MLDFYQISQLLTPEERQVQTTARDFFEAEAGPYIAQWWEEGTFPTDFPTKLGKLGFLGPWLPAEYGGAGLGSNAYGLILYEAERLDSGLRSFASVTGSLVMYPIYSYGSDEQKQKYLPELSSGRIVGCFGLTEHDGGSDPGAMKTRAIRDGDEYILNGVKMWITNGNIADIAIVWARDQDDVIRGFIVPTETRGFTTNQIHHKMSMRASVTSELVLSNVRVSAKQMLPGAHGLRGPLSVLTQARFGICWGAMGALEAVHAEAVRFAMNRSTFGRPIAARQLVQSKLADMLADHTKGMLLALRLGQMKDAGTMTAGQVSLAKRENVRAALRGARAARDILGGSGITLEYSAIRHMLNLETVDTYEGTYDVHTLVLGREVTGLDAFTA